MERTREDAGDYWELQRAQRMRDRLSFTSIVSDPLRELPQVRLAGVALPRAHKC